jgi:hypothetical protein
MDPDLHMIVDYLLNLGTTEVVVEVGRNFHIIMVVVMVGRNFRSLDRCFRFQISKDHLVLERMNFIVQIMVKIDFNHQIEIGHMEVVKEINNRIMNQKIMDIHLFISLEFHRLEHITVNIHKGVDMEQS